MSQTELLFIDSHIRWDFVRHSCKQIISELHKLHRHDKIAIFTIIYSIYNHSSVSGLVPCFITFVLFLKSECHFRTTTSYLLELHKTNVRLVRAIRPLGEDLIRLRILSYTSGRELCITAQCHLHQHSHCTVSPTSVQSHLVTVQCRLYQCITCAGHRTTYICAVSARHCTVTYSE